MAEHGKLLQPQQGDSEKSWLRERFDSDEIDLKALWSTLWARKWSILSIIIVVMMLALLVTSNMTPIYRSTATLLIEPPTQRVVSIEQVYSPEGASSRNFVGTQIELLQSRALRTRVVRELNLHTHYEFDPGQQDPPLIDVSGWVRSLQGWVIQFDLQRLIPGMTPTDFDRLDDQLRVPSEEEQIERTARALGGRLTVEDVRNSQLVLVSVEMADRFMATEVANTLAQGYIDQQLDASLGQSMSAANWMSGRLGELRNNLRSAEQRLQTFRDNNDLIDVSGILTVSANELSSISERLIAGSQRRAEAESRFRQIEAMRDQGWERISSVPAVLSESLVQQFKRDEAQARARIEELSTRYGPRHPSMQAAQSDLEAARTNLRTQVEQVVASIETEYELALANERALRAALEDNREEVQELSRQDFEFQELSREVEANRALYQTFLTRLQETTATMDLEPIGARIVDSAQVPTAPVSPRVQQIVLIAGVLAGMGGCGLALLLVALDSTFRGSEEVEDTLNLPVLGILPLEKKAASQKDARRLLLNPDMKTFAEAVRTIRTGLLLSGVDRPQNTILVTSSVPGEGKSTLASNLALALGQMDSIVLVDADMRRPALGRSYGLSAGSPGLANIILGHATVAECLHPVDGMHILPAGTVPPNPLELLASKSFQSVVEALCKQFDRVVIDSPPVHAVSDALILSRNVDAVIFVMNTHKTHRAQVIRAVGQLLQAGAPVIGTVMNLVNVAKAKRYGYSYGGYYDYYGYSGNRSGGSWTRRIARAVTGRRHDVESSDDTSKWPEQYVGGGRVPVGRGFQSSAGRDLDELDRTLRDPRV